MYTSCETLRACDALGDEVNDLPTRSLLADVEDDIGARRFIFVTVDMSDTCDRRAGNDLPGHADNSSIGNCWVVE